MIGVMIHSRNTQLFYFKNRNNIKNSSNFKIILIIFIIIFLSFIEIKLDFIRFYNSSLLTLHFERAPLDFKKIQLVRFVLKFRSTTRYRQI